MSPLPVGWTVSNKDGARAGPPRRPSRDAESEGEGSDDMHQGLDITPDSPGWEDIDAEEDDDLGVQCLLCARSFPQTRPMLDHCATEHGFDFLAVVKQHSLDFYKTIKLVNYVREAASKGAAPPETSDARVWEDDRYLQPVLEDDALLFSLDDLVDDAAGSQDGKVPDYDELEAAKLAMEHRTDLQDVPE